MLLLALLLAIADPTPRACVDCHTGAANKPARLTTVTVNAKLLAKVQGAAPKSMALKGKHPAVTAMVKDVPGGCLKCHAQGSKMAPPLSQLAHVIHLTQGTAVDCASCHKLNTTTGDMTIPSAAP